MSSRYPIKKIIISRTDAIGDVMLTLPMAGLLRKEFPEAKIIFFGKTYTKSVIECCSSVDEFINYDAFEKEDEKGRVDFLKNTGADLIIHVYPRKNIASAAKAAGIKERIGTRNRIYHWLTCNKLVALSRKRSGSHESVLNMKLLQPLGIRYEFNKEELISFYTFTNIPELPEKFIPLPEPTKIKLILHPKSHGSAREWSESHYEELISLLPADRFIIYITGGAAERDKMEFWLRELPSHVISTAGMFTLPQLIAFISQCDGIVAASTGPLHIAAALGKFALGLYPPIEPMDPSRWAPLGKNASSLVIEKKCDDCRLVPEECHCMNEILPTVVAQRIREYFQV